MSGPYELGQELYLTATFTTGGTVEDPTEVTLALKKPAMPSVEYTYGGLDVTRVSKGVYRVTLQTDVAGRWKYRWTATGLVKTSGQAEFTVNKANA